MRTIIEDDVLFTEKAWNKLIFKRKDNTLLVFDEDEKVGKLVIHYDWEMEYSLKDEGVEYTFEDVHYVYINNELVFLYKLNL